MGHWGFDAAAVLACAERLTVPFATRAVVRALAEVERRRVTDQVVGSILQAMAARTGPTGSIVWEPLAGQVAAAK